MDELKKKIEALTPQNAFYAVAGMLALMLLLFLVGDVIEAKEGGKTISFTGWKCMTSYSEGLEGIGSASLSIGMGRFFAWIYVAAVVALLYLAYAKKVVNYMYCIVPAVALFIMKFTATFTATITFMGKTKTETADFPASMTVMFWVIVIINVALVAFAYFRGNNPVALDKK